MREDQGTNSFDRLNRWRRAGSELWGATGWEHGRSGRASTCSSSELGPRHGGEAFQGTAAGAQASRAVLTRRLWHRAGRMGPRGPEQLQKAHVL